MGKLTFKSLTGILLTIMLLSFLISCSSTEDKPPVDTDVTLKKSVKKDNTKQEILPKPSKQIDSDIFKAKGKNISLSLISETEFEYTAAYNKTYVYSINYKNEKSGTFILDVYNLNNNDTYYCLRAEGIKDIPETLKISLNMDVSDEYKYRYYSYPEGRSNDSSVLNGPFDSKETPLNVPYTSYIEGESFSMVASCVNAYQQKQNQVLKDMVSESSYITLKNGKITGDFLIKKDYVTEHWGIVSKKQLVDFEDKKQTATAKLADYGQYRKWSMNGQYYITPSSYVPSGDDYFYKNVAHHVGEKFLHSTGRYFYDMSVISLYTAVQDQNDKGVWYTTPESNWLSGDYNIGDNFYDTRFNTDCGLFLIRGYRKFKDPVLLKAAIKYGNFLINFAVTHHFTTLNGGYLVWDYTDDKSSLTPTHVSLNHLVTEMNFLYELYIETGKPVYMLLGDKIKLAVDDTYKGWPKDNNDLWYAFMKDGTYGLKDYVNLTLRDLKYSQKLINQIHGKTDEKFKFLIDTKESYLKSNNLPLGRE